MKVSLPYRGQGKNPSFSKLLVKEVMRRNPETLHADDTIGSAVRTLIKNKIDAVLVVDRDGIGRGVVTKTEIMGTYFAGIGPETHLGDIMGAPVIHCGPGDTIETALVTMQRYGIHRVYVFDGEKRVLGSLSYPDIVGILYRCCCSCAYSLRGRGDLAGHGMARLLVTNVMTSPVTALEDNASLTDVIETISSYRIGAVLIVNREGDPAGVVSKTNLALAYHRGIGLEQPASVVMSRPVLLCDTAVPLEEAIRSMILGEVSRIFARPAGARRVAGVLTLTDAARARSGSCQACSSTRIIPKG